MFSLSRGFLIIDNERKRKGSTTQWVVINKIKNKSCEFSDLLDFM